MTRRQPTSLHIGLGGAIGLLLGGMGVSVSSAADLPEGMVHVPAGPFVMGVDKEAPKRDVSEMTAIQKLRFRVSKEAFHDEGPAHVVMLDGFLIDQYEVSNKEYAQFLKATGHPAPAYWDDHNRNRPEQPVSGVNWYDANAYCGWANKRLPTEAEWEKAARGPEGFLYPWGNELKAENANFGRKQELTANVTAFPEGKSGYGAYNMAGNVFEWVFDWYDPNYYQGSKTVSNPTGPAKPVTIGSTGTFVDFVAAGEKKVIRGGSWFTPAESITATHRFWNDPLNNSYGVGLGFRCASNTSEDTQEQARGLYMNALIKMGAEKYPEALVAIDKAIKADPNNREYQNLRKMIEKQAK